MFILSKNFQIPKKNVQNIFLLGNNTNLGQYKRTLGTTVNLHPSGIFYVLSEG